MSIVARCFSPIQFHLSRLHLFLQLPLSFKNLMFLSTEAPPDKERVIDEDLKELFATIEDAPASNVNNNSAYIHKMCEAENLSNDKNISLTPNMCNAILVGASQKNDINLSCQVFKKSLLSSKSPSATSCLNFARAFTKVNDCKELLRFITEVSEINCSSTSLINRIIFAFAKSGQKDKALVIFDHLKRQNYSVDLITYNIVLDILGCIGHVDEMVDVFESMKDTSFDPDIVSYNTLINGLKKVGRFDMCNVYFKEMSENGIEPDLLTYTALIEGFGRSGNAEESLKCFREMKLKGVLPSIYIYRSLTDNLNKTGKVELAAQILEEMNSSSTCLAGPEDFKRKRRRKNT
ncbi:hypothetical protein Lal_00045801 [Lupinus albus]|uniref:Putative tetratricopeptide-like helical domain-containing protein n=1 Tax=Lupinus albus TaxID=3870 RepID=A0A6A4PEJ7_LUPAL|nr:putative tetratricopeptide-like helical domain-containing protein [Lupinus albus]KAF1886568.1 hypothetical protein Lal_00045801 [Lupinus albus]